MKHKPTWPLDLDHLLVYLKHHIACKIIKPFRKGTGAQELSPADNAGHPASGTGSYGFSSKANPRLSF